MNLHRIRVGIAAWFLGILIPVLHHSLLNLAVGDTVTNNVVTRSQLLLRSLPWFDWVYLAAMWLVGLILVVTGLRSRQD